MKKVILTIAAVTVGVIGSIGWAPPASALLNNSALKSEACSGIDAGSGNACAQASNVTNLVTVVINVLSYIVGIVAVIFLMIGGFKYITSNGDANKVSSAKMTIIYALIGVFLVAIAQILVNFVITKASAA